MEIIIFSLVVIGITALISWNIKNILEKLALNKQVLERIFLMK